MIFTSSGGLFCRYIFSNPFPKKLYYFRERAIKEVSKVKKYLYMIISLIVLASVLVACGVGANDQKDEGKEQTTENADKTNEEATEEEQVTPTGDNPIVTMTMENGGEVQMELYPEIAPNTVNNFISLVEDGFR